MVGSPGRHESTGRQSLFDALLLLLSAGADYRISGRSLVVAGVKFEMDDVQRDLAWNAIKEGEDV